MKRFATVTSGLRPLLLAALSALAAFSLVPGASAADLILKSRAICPGRPGSVPVSVVSVGGSGLLVGMDMGLKFSPRAVLPLPDWNGLSFIPYETTDERGIVISGVPVAPPNLPGPDLYVGYVRGVSPMDTRQNRDGSPAGTIGLVRVQVAPAAPVGMVIDDAPMDYYYVGNSGDATTWDTRPGATGATIGFFPTGPILPEPMHTLDVMPGAVRPGTLRVPLHKIAVGTPGDLNGDGRVDVRDASILSAGLYTWARRPLTAYQLIAADVAPLNGYVPGVNPFGSGPNLNGGSYGDGKVDEQDLALITDRAFRRPSAANFPVCE